MGRGFDSHRSAIALHSYSFLLITLLKNLGSNVRVTSQLTWQSNFLIKNGQQVRFLQRRESVIPLQFSPKLIIGNSNLNRYFGCYPRGHGFESHMRLILHQLSWLERFLTIGKFLYLTYCVSVRSNKNNSVWHRTYYRRSLDGQKASDSVQN